MVITALGKPDPPEDVKLAAMLWDVSEPATASACCVACVPAACASDTAVATVDFSTALTRFDSVFSILMIMDILGPEVDFAGAPDTLTSPARGCALFAVGAELAGAFA